jgi:hypothetical protein
VWEGTMNWQASTSGNREPHESPHVHAIRRGSDSDSE